MKVDEIRDAAAHRAGELAGTAQKAAYAAAGAPLVVGRRLAEYGGKVGEGLKHELEAFVAEGERLVGRIRDRNVVDDLKDRVDIDHLQDRVERLRDQLEDVLANWRESFRPQDGGEDAPGRDAPGEDVVAAEELSAD